MLKRRDFLRLFSLTGAYLCLEGPYRAYGKLLGQSSTAEALARNLKEPGYRAAILFRESVKLHHQGQFQEALALFKKAKALTEMARAWAKDEALTAMAEAQVSFGKYHEALKTLERVPVGNYRRDLTAAKVSLKASLDEEWALSDRALSLVDSGMLPVCATLLLQDSIPSERHLLWAEKVAGITSESRRYVIYSCLSEAYFRVGNRKRALYYLEQLWPLEPEGAVCLVCENLEWAQIKKAVSRVAEIEEFHSKVNSFFRLLEHFAKKDRKEAEEVLKRILQEAKVHPVPHEAASVLVKVASEYLKMGKKDQALELLKEAFEALPEGPEDETSEMETNFVFTDIITEYIRAGMDSRVPELLKRYLKKGYAYELPLPYSVIATSLKDSSSRARALRFLDKELNSLRDPDIKSLSEIAGAYLKLAEKKKGRTIVRKTLALARRYSKAEVAPSLRDLCHLYAKAGLYNEALATVELIPEPHEKEACLVEVIDFLAHNGKYSLAFRLTKGIRDYRLRERKRYEILKL